MYWWDYILMYPAETATTIALCVVGYFGYLEISKFWNKPLYITNLGEWRILRYVGRILKMENKRMFYKDTEVNEFRCIVKISGQKKRPMILESKDIIGIEPRRIVMGKKYIYWDSKKAAYVLSDLRPLGYMINPDNLERMALAKIDDIDTKSTRAARAAPQVVHAGLLQYSIPIDPSDYREDDTNSRLQVSSSQLFDRDLMGDYDTLDSIHTKHLRKRNGEEVGDRRYRPE